MAIQSEKNRKRLIVVGGPTASGKTAVAIAIAQYFKTEVISADSRQFYREMSIGTAKPTSEERAMVPHHFINSLSVTDDYSVGHFERDALALLDQLFEQHDRVVVAGGSGLFIQALCQGLDVFPDVRPEIWEDIDQQFKLHGIDWLRAQLERLDPEYFAEVDQHNPARMRRAVEVSWSTEQPYSSFLGKGGAQRPFSIDYILLERPRAELYARINQRVDRMMTDGLEAEVRALLPYRHLPPLNTVGYQELFRYFDGEWSIDLAIDKIKQHSRNYAKRQMTWFRKYGYWKVISPDDEKKLILDLDKLH